MDDLAELSLIWPTLCVPVQQAILTLAKSAVSESQIKPTKGADYLSVTQVAKKLGKRPETIRNWIEEGQINAVRLGDESRSKLGIRPEWITDFERKRMVIPPVKQQRRKFAKPAVEYV